MHRSAILAVLLLSICLLVSGCGGGSSNKTAVVSQIILSPTSLSLNSGDVGQIQAIPENSSNAQVTANITFSSSNSAIVTVSNAGLVCAGVWDSLTTPINCNGISGGNPVSGMATVTVTAGGVSNTVAVAVHAKVTKITVDPVAGCTSSSQMKQFTAHAFSGANDITSQIGQFTWGTLDSSVATVDNTGLLTAHNPGATQVFAGASGLNSAGTP